MCYCQKSFYVLVPQSISIHPSSFIASTRSWTREHDLKCQTNVTREPLWPLLVVNEVNVPYGRTFSWGRRPGIPSHTYLYMLSFPTVMLLSFFLSLCGEENSSSNSCTLVCFPGKWYRVGSSSMVTAFSDALLGKQTKWILWSVILSGRKRAERPQTFGNFLEMKQRWSDETFRIPSSKY